MLDDAWKALTQIVTPPLRTMLWKTIGLALVLLVAGGIALHRVLFWVAERGGTWIEATFGSGMHGLVGWAETLFAIAAALGVAAAAIFLMPVVTALVGSFFADEIAEAVERAHYPADRPGVAVPLLPALWEGLKGALWALLVYVLALLTVVFAGAGLVVFFLATAYVLGREYFALAAMRFRPVAEAKALRRRHQHVVFTAGLLIAGFVSVPILNLATPLFGTALMVHVHKRLSQR